MKTLGSTFSEPICPMKEVKSGFASFDNCTSTTRYKAGVTIQYIVGLGSEYIHLKEHV